MNINEKNKRLLNAFPPQDGGADTVVERNGRLSGRLKVCRGDSRGLPGRSQTAGSTVNGDGGEQEMISATKRSGKKRDFASLSSQWKIVADLDEGRDADHRNEEDEGADKHGTGQRLLRDANAFYRNDTSNFLGELQQAENLLFEKAGMVSKIDFLPPKRKATRIAKVSNPQGRNIDAMLSDTGFAPAPPAEKKSSKKSEPEKVIVDVNDFVETFSVMREPEYLVGREKCKSAAHETRSEFEYLLDQVQMKREIAKTCETLDRVSDSMGQAVLDEISEGMGNAEDGVTVEEHRQIETETEKVVTEHVIHRVETVTASPVADEAIIAMAQEVIAEEKIVGENHVAETTVDQTVVIETVTTIVETPTPEPEVVKAVETTEPVETLKPVESIEPTVEEKAVVAKAQVTESAAKNEVNTSTHAGTNVETVRTTFKRDAVADVVAIRESSCPQPVPVVPELPEVLVRLEEFAGDQCDGLAEYVKDKVYDGSRLIAFCGMKRGVGCSTMTLLAAKGMTRHGLKTAVIDANFEFPRLNALVTGKQESGDSWVDILHGTTDWETLALTPKDMPLLTVFPLAENALANWSRYEPERLQQETNRLVTTLQEHFDLILLDCGCFEGDFEEITWGELELFQPDGVVLVRDPKETPIEVIAPYCREILSGGISAFGVAENFV